MKHHETIRKPISIESTLRPLTGCDPFESIVARRSVGNDWKTNVKRCQACSAMLQYAAMLPGQPTTQRESNNALKKTPVEKNVNMAKGPTW